jgi:glucan biosynthesis protein C
MMMLGIVLHACMLYLAEPPARYPFPTDHNTAYVFNVLLAFIHSFRMPTFFVLAGFFTSLLTWHQGHLYQPRSAAALAAGMVTILPLTGLFMVTFMLSARYGTHDFIPSFDAVQTFKQELIAHGFPIDKPTLGHLWFLYYLCFFYLLIPLCDFLVRYSLKSEDRVKRWLVSPLLPVMLAVLRRQFRNGLRLSLSHFCLPRGSVLSRAVLAVSCSRFHSTRAISTSAPAARTRRSSWRGV